MVYAKWGVDMEVCPMVLKPSFQLPSISEFQIICCCMQQNANQQRLLLHRTAFIQLLQYPVGDGYYDL
jgi:hypothetical protein